MLPIKRCTHIWSIPKQTSSYTSAPGAGIFIYKRARSEAFMRGQNRRKARMRPKQHFTTAHSVRGNEPTESGSGADTKLTTRSILLRQADIVKDCGGATMSAGDYVLITAVVIAVAAAVWGTARGRRKGGCCGNCASCCRSEEKCGGNRSKRTMSSSQSRKPGTKSQPEDDINCE